MIRIYCDKCEEEVEIKRDCICPKCKTDWTKEVTKEVDLDEVFSGIKPGDADETVDYILNWAQYTKFIYGIIGFVAIVSGVVLMFSDFILGIIWFLWNYANFIRLCDLFSFICSYGDFYSDSF